MSTTNCRCGLVAVANCVECREGTCQSHLRDQTSLSVTTLRAFPSAPSETADDNAYMRGYWKTPQDHFKCPRCRNHDAEAEVARFRRISADWPTDPFWYALTAAAHGYVYSNLGLSYDGLVDAWLAVKPRAKSVTATWITRPPQTKQNWLTGKSTTKPAQTTTVTAQGWIFPRTALGDTSTPYGSQSVGWINPTVLLQDGRLFQNDELLPRPLTQHVEEGASAALLIEMSRLMFSINNWPWNGPAER